jgi:hypothetical protein
VWRARLVITAVVIERRTPTVVIAEYGVSKSWLYELLTRCKLEGDAAFEPLSRPPHIPRRPSPRQWSPGHMDVQKVGRIPDEGGLRIHRSNSDGRTRRRTSEGRWRQGQ